MPTGIDAKLTQDAGGIWDMAIADNGDIETEDAFDTYLLVGHFADKRASDSEVLTAKRRGGWIGNEDTPGFEMGSKFWLIERGRANRAAALSADAYASEVLANMVDEGIALKYSIATTVETEGITVRETIVRPSSKIEYRYFNLWENTGE